jgi:quinol monooxygenase YgiN
MIGLVAILSIKPGKENEVAEACRVMAEKVHELEKDCLFYEPFISEENPREIYFLETYADHESLELHRETEHYKNYREAIKDAVTEPPRVTLLKAIT